MNALLNKTLIFLEKSRRTHYYCDDGWYTCPKHPDGCSNKQIEKKCNCGADEFNNELNELVKQIKMKAESS
jgi:hypothetical protein